MHTYPTLQFGLGEETDTMRDAVRALVAEEILPLADRIDRNGEFQQPVWEKIAALGLLGITAPKKYGGLGLGYRDHVVAMEEISRGSASVGLVYGVHSNLCINHINLHGTSEQKQRFLPPLINGEYLGALAMSEATAGSDVTSMKLEAVKSNDKYILNGSKMWITNGPVADLVIVYAKTSPTKGAKGISAFLVETKLPGFSTGQPLDKLGMRGSPTSSLLFENCEVPEENLLGEIDQGVKLLMRGLAFERLILSGGPLGIMASCMDLVLPYIHKRKQFDKAIGEFQIMQAKIADMYTTWNACRSYVYTVAAAADRGENIKKDAAGAILYTSERATRMALEAIQCLGGKGYLNDFPAGRLLRDAKLYEIGAGTSEIRRMLIGRELFRETAEK